MVGALPNVVRRGGVVGIVVRGRGNVVVVVNRSLRRKKVQQANALKGKGVDVHGVFPPSAVGASLGPNK